VLSEQSNFIDFSIVSGGYTPFNYNFDNYSPIANYIEP